MIRSARSIARLIEGTFRSGQLELFDDVMFLPLNVTSRTVCGSWKSGSHPTVGQMFGSFFGTLQKRVYIVACVTEIVLTLMPILARSAATTSAVFEPGGVLSATWVSCAPVYMPVGLPAFRMFDFAIATSPAKPLLGNGSNEYPPAFLKPWSLKLGSTKCVAIRPSTGPPRVRRIAFRSRTYATAFRTSTLLNGALGVCNAM